MNTGELIQELQKLDPNLVIFKKNCGWYEEVRIFKSGSADFVRSPSIQYSPSEESRTVPEESKTVPEPFFGDWR